MLAPLTTVVMIIIIIGGRCICPEVVDLPTAPGAPLLATGPLLRGRSGLLEVVVDGLLILVIRQVDTQVMGITPEPGIPDFFILVR